jgi:hypothetical protein
VRVGTETVAVAGPAGVGVAGRAVGVGGAGAAGALGKEHVISISPIRIRQVERRVRLICHNHTIRDYRCGLFVAHL